MTEPCACPVAGYCQRHQMTKGKSLHELCQKRDDYRAKWDSLVTGKPYEPPWHECVHRGQPTGETHAVTSCPLSKGRIEEVFACAIHGTCTLRRWTLLLKDNPEQTCIRCQERTAIAPRSDV